MQIQTASVEQAVEQSRSAAVFYSNHSDIKWNFTKFLITSKGKPYKRYAPTVKPFAIKNDIVKLLEKREE